jgi:hypothetical protein
MLWGAIFVCKYQMPIVSNRTLSGHKVQVSWVGSVNGRLPSVHPWGEVAL